MNSHLIVRQGALGDFLLTFPLLRAAAADGPTLLACPRRHAAILPHGAFDLECVLDSDSAVISSLYGSSPDPSLVAGRCIHLFQKPDVAMECALCRSGARRVVWHEPRPVSPPHIARRYLEEAGLAVSEHLEESPSMPRQQDCGDSLWIHAGSGSLAKNIPALVWGEHSRSWLKEHPAAKIVVSFGEADEHLKPEFRLAFRDLSYEEVSGLTLSELKEQLAKRAICYWGADTGVTHLAAALGIPVTAVFRSTEPLLWRPCGRVKISVWTPDRGKNHE